MARYKLDHTAVQHLSVDESMIRFKGRSSLKQYNPMKPITRDYKLWCIADNHEYVYKLETYTKKNSAEENPLKKELGLWGMMVTQLTEKLKKNHQVLFDYFFINFIYGSSLIIFFINCKPTKRWHVKPPARREKIFLQCLMTNN